MAYTLVSTITAEDRLQALLRQMDFLISLGDDVPSTLDAEALKRVLKLVARKVDALQLQVKPIKVRKENPFEFGLGCGRVCIAQAIRR
ncbi:hypothetical protein [Hyphomicrobium sp. DMF-1]|uniref:hypothetical protein n=1 Tax=Hyphomicrobium sp. DMF-1 TaxID=3019544 RepID=UPI0022EC0FBF|nr:hypothetical protein [Hyphomicrobium sp. DMF-1]WBT39177.1 hypothetical protein PE058_04660 [Hyphomicrobium sp. DMF-1]